MILHPRQFQDNAPDYDLCIVGAGAAGISLALEFANSGQRICLLEAGGFGYARQTQQLLDGGLTGDPYPRLRETRLGALGGTTNVWAGWCRPLDARDFQCASRTAADNWPFGQHELLPCYRRAHAVCGLGEFEYDARYWEKRLGLSGLALRDARIVERIFQVNAQKFGVRYRRALETSDNIHLVLHTPAIRCRLDRSGQRIECIEVCMPAGRRTTVKARYFVLAAGGIENPRLLLASAEAPARAPGNAHDLVGRYFTDHAFVDCGMLRLAGKALGLEYYFPQAMDPTERTATVRATLSLADSFVTRENLQNGALFFHPRYESHPVFNSAQVRALLLAWDKLRGRAVPGDTGRYLRQALGAPGKLGMAIARKLLVRAGPARSWRLRGMFETEARYTNRVTLSRACDRLGRPLPHIEWRLGQKDLADMRRFVRVVDDALRKAGIGRIQPAFADTPSAWRRAVEAGIHHMGTTRMHRDPRQGVVDANSRLHGIANLFVTGSSVFPNGGYANPTLTIVALAIRLGDHLKGLLRP